MNTLRKLGYSILASVFVFANANAGEFGVSGSVKGTYSIVSVDGSQTDDDAGKGLGLTNEFSLTASGELDNGWTWAYNQDIDAATVQDDAGLTMGLGGLGSVKLNISDGGLQKNFSSSQSVYGTPVDTGESGTYTDSPDTGAMNTIRYTTPSGLPFDLVAAIQFAPGSGENPNASGNSGGTIDGAYEDAMEYAVSFVPTEGLSVGASYFDPDDSATAQETEGGAWYATYAIGSVSVGYGKSYQATSIAPGAGNVADYYENTQMSLAFNVNDALSISYEDVEAEKSFTTNTSDVTMDVTSVQASYTVAGMTLSISQDEFDNHDYTSGNKIKETLFGMSIAF